LRPVKSLPSKGWLISPRCDLWYNPSVGSKI
jgi:hypothetical protein